MSNPQWAAFEKLISEFLDKIKGEGLPTATEWDVLKTTLIREGELRGIHRLMQEVYVQIETITEKENSRDEPARDYSPAM